MDLSIVIPAFNNSNHLAATLAHMTHYCAGFDYEIIVVDYSSESGE